MRNYLLFLLAIPITASAPAQAADFTGPRVEAHVGWERVRFPTASGGTLKSKDNGFFYGGGAGYDFALGSKMIAGIEGGFHLSTAKAEVQSGNTLLERRAKWDFDVGARIGAIVTPGVLLYAKAGYARGRDEEKLTVTGTAGTTVTRDRHQRDGLRLGAGGEVALADGVYAKAEYRYTGYEDDLKRHQIMTGVGVRF